jgi:hypothetical protein
VGAERPRRSTGGPHPDACSPIDGRHDPERRLHPHAAVGSLGGRGHHPATRPQRRPHSARAEGNRMSATIQDPPPLHEPAPGLRLAHGGPGRTLNVYLLGDVVVDSGVRWSRRRLARQLVGAADRRARAHPRPLRPRRLLGVAVPHLRPAPVGAAPATPRRSPAATSTPTARRWSTGCSAAWRRSPPTPSAAPWRKATSLGGSRCWRSPGTRRARWRCGASGTGAGLRRRAGQLRPASQAATPISL